VAARRLLVVTYHHPPDRSGGHRWALMSQWLRTLGHEVVTIAGATYGGLPDDCLTNTHRVSDLASSERLRRLLRRPPLGPSSDGFAQDRPLRLLTESVVPDATLVTWVPGALRATRRLLRAQRFDGIVTTGPPQSVHLIGLLLGGSRPAWVADLRDGWRFEPLRGPWPLALQERLDAALERQVISRAEGVIGVTLPIAQDIRARLGVQAAYVPNGFDPRWCEEVPDSDLPKLDSGKINIVHTGTLSGPRGRDPRPFLEGLRQVNSANANRIQLVVAGRLTVEDRRLLLQARLGDAVKHVGLLDRRSAIALQRRAHALLLLTGTHVSEATGKLYEYLASGRPIVALAQGNEAARIVTETATGVTVPPDDVGGIAQALDSAIDGSLLSSYAPRGLDRYVYPGPAEAVAELIERSIARRATT
jgi:glycosyltransferase involved in cell wall biosynthesis